MDEKITIVLPTYNGSENIKKSINSIINQTYQNWELIAVNDCSTDNTKDILEEYANKDSRIKVINNLTNQKLPRSLNIGFAQATGQLLTWTSDDNAFHSNALEVMALALSNNPHIDMVYADFYIVDMDGNIKSEEKKQEPELLRFTNTVGACFLYRATLAAKIGQYDPDLFLAEDYEYWIRAYINGSLMHISENLYDYGWHDKSLTVTRKNEIGKQTFKAQTKHIDALLKKCTTQNERNEFFWAMISLLSNKSDYIEARNRFYAMDKAFAQADRKLRVQNCTQQILYLLKRIVKKFTRLRHEGNK